MDRTGKKRMARTEENKGIKAVGRQLKGLICI